MKRIFCLLLALLTVLCVFSCASPTSGNEKDSADASANVSDTEPETALLEYLGAHDFDGRHYTALVSGADNGEWRKNVIAGDKNDTEIVNVARCERNSIVEDKYNVVIDSIEMFGTGGSGPCFNAVLTSANAGDESYNAVFLGCYEMANLTTRGVFKNQLEMDALDLDGSWWDAKSVQDLKIMDKLYTTVNAICTTTNDATLAVLFNKVIARDRNIATPYENVLNGTWTYEMMETLCRDCSMDLNSDGKTDDKDLVGLLLWWGALPGVFNSAGEYCCRTDENGEIVYSLATERASEVMTAFLHFATDRSLTICYDLYGYSSYDIFAGDHALFYMQEVNRIEAFRDMESDFGVLPMPKLSVDQKEYYSNVASYDGIMVGVPNIISDEDFTGVVLEAMAYLSGQYVTPMYYDIVLQRKFMRDSESQQMLDIIFTSRMYDLGWLYSIGSIESSFTELLTSTKSVTTLLARKTRQAENQVAKLNKTFAAMK